MLTALFFPASTGLASTTGTGFGAASRALTGTRLAAASTAFRGLLLLLGATCTRFSASTGRLAATDHEGPAGEQTGNTDPGQQLLQVLFFHPLSPPLILYFKYDGL